jgi:hypothetical protein
MLNPQLQFDLDLSITDKEGEFLLKKENVSYRPEYTLEIPNTTDFDFTHNGEDAEKSIQNLLTAINLNLKKVAFTRHIYDRYHEKVTYTEQEKEEYDHIDTTVRYHGRSEVDLSEKSVIQTFDKLNELNRFDLNNPTIKEMNLIKAVSLYENAVGYSNRFAQHAMLYMAMETACLYDGDYVTGSDLDQRMSNLSGIAEADIKKWRNRYNRQKHVDQNSSDVAKTQDIIENPQNTRKFRKGANQILHHRL